MNKLVNYSDDSSNESESGDENINISQNNMKAASLKDNERKDYELKRKQPDRKKLLPLPSKIKCMFSNSESNTDSNLHLHEGRKRGFEHVEGNWPTFIYIPINLQRNFEEHQRKLITVLNKSLDFKIHEIMSSDCHLSISRTVPIRHYWIEPILSRLRDLFTSKKIFQYSLDFVKVYTNDDKSRTFIGIEVSNSRNIFIELTKIIDSIFDEFGLEKYYLSPSFHASIAWCLGDKKVEIEEVLKRENMLLKVLFYMNAEKICMKCGNKVYQVCLK